MGCTVDDTPTSWQITSPFQSAGLDAAQDGPLPLTEENVELVLDGLRPFLIADGGNTLLR